MEANSQICPVCTLYLRPGMTLKSHLASHPKQKVIEALCRLSTAEVDPEPEPEPEKQLASTSTNIIQPNPTQQWSPAGLQPAAIPGNHSFIYQQWSSSAPPSNMVNVGQLGQQYVTIPTVLPPQMMCPPYVYQQQQVIMSSGAQLPPMPPLTRMLPIEPSVIEPHAQIIEEIDDELDKIQQPDLVLIENSLDGLNVNIQSQQAEDDEIKEDEIEINEEPLIKSPKPLDLITTFEEGERELGSPGSNASSDFIRVRRDLNKSCQTQSDDEDNYDSGKSEVEDGNYVTLTANQNEGNVCSAPQAVESQNLMDMDGMNLILNADFMQNQIISQVEDFDYNCKYERPAVIMNIGEYNDGRDESVSVDSTNIRADEHMPPRGELSGQESNASDIAWNRIQYAGSSATSYDLLARESWDGSDASDNDNEMPPLQSHVPQEYDINDTPTVSGFSEPPIQYKCSTCGENFNCPKERKEHQAEQHAKPNIVGSRLVGAKKVKKLVIKPKKIDVKTENNFDNVFTNKLKLESAEAENNLLIEAPPVIIDVQKIEEQLIINNPTVCTVCEMVLADGKMLAAHQLEVHNISTEQKYKCAMCGEAFPNEPKFTEHLAVHPLECRLCGKYFYKRQNLQLHMKRHLGIKPFKCIVCEKSFLTKQKLEEHKNIHTGDTPIQCNMCEESFRRHSNLVQHKNRHHFNIKKKIKDYICFCGEVFHSKKKLAWHREIHENKPKACKQCNEKFVHAASLTRHMRRAHNERFVPEPDRFNENVECPICKGVYLKSSLEIHIKNHSGEKPYSCSICNKDFTTKWNLKLHKWTHASRTSKPFKCDQCNGAFIRETDYVAHMNSHKSIKPYTCNYCGAQFIRKYNCQRHVREHEKNKTFSCQVCGKLFHRSYYLKDHMRIHSGVRPYSCHICGKTSTTKSNHNKHVRIHHAREPVSTEN